jgi:hypothetical protein
MSLTIQNCSVGADKQTFALHKLPNPTNDYTYYQVAHVASGLCATAVGVTSSGLVSDARLHASCDR